MQFVICQTGRTVFRQSLDDGETNGANKRKHLGVCCQQGRVSFTKGTLLLFNLCLFISLFIEQFPTLNAIVNFAKILTL